MYPQKNDVEDAIGHLCPTDSVKGTYEELINTLRASLFNLRNCKKAARKYLLGPQARGKPETIAWYGKHFNGVDRLDLKCSFIDVNMRFGHPMIAMLNYIIRMSLVQAHSLTTADISDTGQLNLRATALDDATERRYAWQSTYRRTYVSVRRFHEAMVCRLTDEARQIRNEAQKLRHRKRPASHSSNPTSTSTFVKFLLPSVLLG